MKALALLGNAKVAVQDVPVPEADSQDVLIRVRASAICGSELSAFKGAPSEKAGFLNPGHEVAGVVEKAPAGSEWQPGARVGARVVVGCGRCTFCQQGHDTACPKRKFYPNAHAEYFRVPARALLPIPDAVDWPEAAVLTGDGLGLPARAARRLGDTRAKRVLVLGLGPVGLSNVLVQAFAGAEVMGADLVAYRLDLARKLGARRAANIQEQDIKAEVADWTANAGADIVILAAGREDALLSAFDLVRLQGMVFQVGEIHKATLNPSAAFIAKEITMTGSWYYAPEDWPEMLRLHNSGLPYKDLITHVFPFEKAQEAYDTFASGESGKVVLTYY
ncbi:MAG: zinc-binding dehydrogenase [Kiritimatiellae bacterium]|nr:zinc-binding dehydrogenase [Kiritimatiellia bacterium]